MCCCATCLRIKISLTFSLLVLANYAYPQTMIADVLQGRTYEGIRFFAVYHDSEFNKVELEKTAQSACAAIQNVGTCHAHHHLVTDGSDIKMFKKSDSESRLKPVVLGCVTRDAKLRWVGYRITREGGDKTDWITSTNHRGEHRGDWVVVEFRDIAPKNVSFQFADDDAGARKLQFQMQYGFDFGKGIDVTRVQP